MVNPRSLTLEAEIEEMLNQALNKIKNSDLAFKHKVVKKLRADLNEKIPGLMMDDKRKSYFIHQMANTHQIEDLISLVMDINKNQMKSQSADTKMKETDLLLLKTTNSGMSWITSPFVEH